MIKRFFRRRSLARFGSKVPTAITPLSSVKSAVCFIDVQDTTFDKCKEAILSFFKENAIKGEIFFFDFRKLGREERLITSITTTVLKRDLNWFGKPSKEKLSLMLGSGPDLFISLIDGTDFPIEFMARCSQAKFKVGRQQLPGNVFDMVLSDPFGAKAPQAQVFEEIKKFLKQIG